MKVMVAGPEDNSFANGRTRLYTVGCNQIRAAFADMSSLTSKDEDSILDQMHKKQICSDFIMMVLIFSVLYENAFKQKSSLLSSAVIL